MYVSYQYGTALKPVWANAIVDRITLPEIHMTRPTVPLVFPTWRDLWASLEDVPILLSAADTTLRRRMAGNQRLPQWSSSDGGEALAWGIHALRKWADGEPPQDPAARPGKIRGIHHVVHPALRAIAWPRWLFLERAFLDASATGDLLFAALVLRTMCEEVQRLHALDLDADQLAALAASSKHADRVRLKVFLSIAWTSLGRLPSDMILRGDGWPSLKPMEKAKPRLKEVQGTLNGYVHPNYGSHIAALFPESATAARLLLEAVAVLYEAFFALSWAEQPISDRSKPLGVIPLEPWSRSVRRLQSRTLPELRQNNWTTEVPWLIEWITTKQDDLVTMLRDPIAAPLLSGLPQCTSHGANADEVLRYRMWDGARAIDIIGFASARRAEQLLANEFPSGAPDPGDQVRWLRFNALSLQLVMLIDQAKAAAFKTQLVRQITQGNSVGAWLCVRSLIEHRALAVWLPREVGVSWNAMAGELRAEASLPDDAAEVENPLAKFLAAQANISKEERRSWVMRESGGVRITWLSLDEIVKFAFPEDDRFRDLYALASAVLHGRCGRGVDLIIDSTSSTMRARRVGLVVLERLCSRDEEMDHLSEAGAQLMRLKHAAAFGGTLAATTDTTAQQAFGLLREALWFGIDYFGEGTADSPFRFSSHLQFHQASYTLLEQIGVDVTTCPRMIDNDGASRLCDRWRAPDRDYWFQIPVPLGVAS